MPAAIATVLVIDDDALLREAVRAILEQGGYNVREAADGEAALKFLAANPIDIVLLDILMPRKDGIETLLEMKKQFPGITVYAMSTGSGGKGHDFLSVAAKFGADGILYKPFSPNDVLTLVRSREALPSSPA